MRGMIEFNVLFPQIARYGLPVARRQQPLQQEFRPSRWTRKIHDFTAAGTFTPCHIFARVFCASARARFPMAATT
jgi:hypothetical protein